MTIWNSRGRMFPSFTTLLIDTSWGDSLTTSFQTQGPLHLHGHYKRGIGKPLQMELLMGKSSVYAGIFHCHVCLPEGMSRVLTMNQNDWPQELNWTFSTDNYQSLCARVSEVSDFKPQPWCKNKPSCNKVWLARNSISLRRENPL